MFSRPKLFLTFLGLCLMPLVLLSLINYGNGVRMAEAALLREQQLKSAINKDPIARLLNESQKEPNSTAAANSERLLVDARRNGWIGLVAALLLATLSAGLLSRHWEIGRASCRERV